MTNEAFADLRGKTMGELTPEQYDRAIESWAREQRMSFKEYYRELFDHLFRVIDRLRTPIDMVLHCPACGMQHIDAPESDSRDEIHRLDRSVSDTWSTCWMNPPHRSHRCRGCEHVWRPADVPTNGVLTIATCGKNDSAEIRTPSMWPASDGSAEVFVRGGTIRGHSSREVTHVEAWSEPLVRQIVRDALMSSSEDRMDRTLPAIPARP